jgi:O-acetyl-ADP-ribose deacetylase (regulator of RNase III)
MSAAEATAADALIALLPALRRGEGADDVVAAAAELTLPGFDWPSWRPEAQRFVDEPARVASADATTLRRLLTLHVRAERFDEGHLSWAVREGHVAAIVERLAAMRRHPVAGRIAVLEGDLTRQEVDAIVNAANSSLLGGGGVDGAIHRAAGPELVDECRLLGGCHTGEAKATAGYRLPARVVIHTVGPVWRGGDHGEDALLASCHRASLEIARARGLRTVAFPAISTGIYRFPLARAAGVAVAEVARFLENAPDLEVRFVCFDAVAWRTFADALHALTGASTAG